LLLASIFLRVVGSFVPFIPIAVMTLAAEPPLAVATPSSARAPAVAAPAPAAAPAVAAPAALAKLTRLAQFVITIPPHIASMNFADAFEYDFSKLDEVSLDER
jgi:hypothetical protein